MGGSTNIWECIACGWLTNYPNKPCDGCGVKRWVPGFDTYEQASSLEDRFKVVEKRLVAMKEATMLHSIVLGVMGIVIFMILVKMG